MPDERDEELDPMEEYLTLNTASKEFRISRGTLNFWVRKKAFAVRSVQSDLGQWYYMVKRGDLINFLAKRPRRGRPLKPTKPNA